MKMRVLVTGGTGFLGKSLQKAFEPFLDQFSVFYSGSRFDLKDEFDTMLLFNSVLPHIVIHMAARCGGILANKNSPADFLVDNLKMGINVYEASHRAGVQWVYSLGSVCSYPIHCPTPFKEENIWNGFPEPTNAPYGVAKRTLMMLSQTYREQYDIGGAFLIPVNLYGPNDHFNTVNSHVVPALITKFSDAVINNKPTVECWGTGTATRELFYVEDAAEAIVRAVTTGLDTYLPINLGTGIDISIKDLASMIGNIVGFKGEIVFTGEVSDGQPIRRLDVSRAKQLLGWEAKTKLKDGLVKTIEWYRNNNEEV